MRTSPIANPARVARAAVKAPAVAFLLIACIGGTGARARPASPHQSFGHWRVVHQPANPMGEGAGIEIVSGDLHIWPLPACPPGLASCEVFIASLLWHDFPGRKQRLRVDSNPPLDIGTQVSGTSRELLNEMLKGKAVVGEFYTWPHEAPRYVTYSLNGFREAWRAAGGQS